jgi:hypothetical protein
MRERERQERDQQRKRSELESRAVRHRIGTVTALDPLEVAVGAADTSYTDVRALESAALEVGDTVSVLMWQNDLLVLGTIGGGTAGWVDLDIDSIAGFGVVSGTPAYRKDGNVVRLRGWVSVTSSSNIGIINSFLPADCCPAERMRFIVLQGTNAVTYSARVDVLSSGDVRLMNADPGDDPISLDQISFIAE